jgi:iron complex transport system substrate-binding protein
MTEAAKTGRVYTVPYAPFAWVDRPPGVNRFLGLQWLANMFYPKLYSVDMVEVTKDFYSRLYWVDITDEQALGLLGNSYPPYGGG